MRLFKSITLFVYIFFILSIVLRGMYVVYQPLILDEKFSLFFSLYHSYSQLLTHLPDVHPGGFYFFLKVVLNFVTDTTIVRIVVSTIFQILGILLLLRQYKQQVTKLFILLFVGLNPFFILYAGQIRMYSLVFFFSILSFLCLQHLKQRMSVFYVIALFTVLFIGNMLSYSMFILSFSVVLYLFTVKHFFHRYKYIIFVFLCLMFFQFIVLVNGYDYLRNFSDAGWIPRVSFITIPTVTLTAFGFLDDHYVYYQNILLTISFYSVLIVLWSNSFIRKKVMLLFKQREFLYLFIVPVLIITTLSFITPLLASLPFFWKFVPNVSIFLPRVFLPFVLWLYIYIADKLSQNVKSNGKQVVFVLSISMFLTVYWLIQHTVVINSFRNIIKPVITNVTLPTWPSWYVLDQISSRDSSNIVELKQLYDQSMEFSLLFAKVGNEEYNQSSCSVVDGKELLLFDEDNLHTSMESEKKGMKIIRDSCCTHIEGNHWTCSASTLK